MDKTTSGRRFGLMGVIQRKLLFPSVGFAVVTQRPNDKRLPIASISALEFTV